jgi:hypothetical protein
MYDDYQSYSKDNNYQYEKNKDAWWEAFRKWLCDYDKGGHNGGGGYDPCRDSKGGWGNDDGCIDSAEIWKRWYCW